MLFQVFSGLFCASSFPSGEGFFRRHDDNSNNNKNENKNKKTKKEKKKKEEEKKETQKEKEEGSEREEGRRSKCLGFAIFQIILTIFHPVRSHSSGEEVIWPEGKTFHPSQEMLGFFVASGKVRYNPEN